MSKQKYRYVEVTDGDRFRAVVPSDPMTLREAEHLALQNTADAWGGSIGKLSVYVTRTITPRKHQRLTEQIQLGTLNPDWWIHATPGSQH